ncbi:hypothetical protein NVP1081O_317 [Vibrio phage 1.081.O._10N.286.52.C2]|nr:hypothetical protein NVP1081O_317 [Vibrio phage 1.081.O._10N.286.52.C2]
MIEFNNVALHESLLRVSREYGIKTKRFLPPGVYVVTEGDQVHWVTDLMKQIEQLRIQPDGFDSGYAILSVLGGHILAKTRWLDRVKPYKESTMGIMPGNLLIIADRTYG